MFMLCLVGMCHAPVPSHHRLLPRAKSCLALFPNPTAPALRNRTSDSRHTFHPLPTRFHSLSLLTFPHSSAALSIHLSFPHRPSPILATFLSMACVLKRFPLTSPRKLTLTCVKRGFLRTAEPHRTLQISPCAPQASQCHVYVMSGSDVACPAPSARCHAPALHHRLLPRAKSCLAMCPNPTAPALRNRTSDPDTLAILSLLACHHSPAALSIPLSSPHRPSQF